MKAKGQYTEVRDLGEVEAVIRQQLTGVVTSLRMGRDLTSVLNAATDTILEAVGAYCPRPGGAAPKARAAAKAPVRQIREKPAEPVHLRTKCYVGGKHECHGPLACNGSCWMPRKVPMTKDRAKVTCGRCKISRAFKAAA